MFVAIDGLDGSGKSSAAQSLSAALRARGVRVEVREHPGAGLPGRVCRRLLLHRGHVAAALSAAFLVADMLGTSRAARRADPGTVVIAIRYDLSAYFLDGRAAGLMHRFFCGFMTMPDLDILIDVDPDTALARISARGLEEEMFENRGSMERARAGMLSARGVSVIDGSGTREETADALMALVWPAVGTLTI